MIVDEESGVAYVTITDANQSNGVIHGIVQVLLPEEVSFRFMLGGIAVPVPRAAIFYPVVPDRFAA